MKIKNTRIPYGLNVYNQDEINAVVRTLKKSTQMGENVNKFEKKISKLFSKKFGLMTNSGSSALLLALKAVSFKKGSEIIVPCLNFGTAISSITLSDLVPVFVDCNIETLQINIKQIENKITKRTKALLIPNLIGNIPDWKRIKKIAKHSNPYYKATINNGLSYHQNMENKYTRLMSQKLSRDQYSQWLERLDNKNTKQYALSEAKRLCG